MSSRLSNHSTESNSKYNDKELFKSIDLKFFEDEDRLDSPETETLNETFTKSSRPLETEILRESAAYEDDFLSGVESEDSFVGSSGSAKFRDDDEVDNRFSESLVINGIKLPSARSELYDEEEDEKARLTDVSPLTSSDESVTEDSSSYAKPKQQNLPSGLLPRERVVSKSKRGANSISTRPKSGASSRGVPNSSRQILNPTTDASDISKILENVLLIDNDDDQESCFSSVNRKLRLQQQGRTNKKNLSVSAFKAREIDRENQRLLSKLKKPHRKPLYPGSQAQAAFKRCHSAGINRSKKFEEIDEENSKILQRLEKVKSSKFLSKDTLENEHRDFVRYALNCSKSKNIAGITDYPGSSSSSRPLSGTRTLNAWE